MKTRISAHALSRIESRLNPEERVVLIKSLTEFAESHDDGMSYGVRCMVLKSQRNDAWSDTSNGDVVVAIVRNGCVETSMLRRSSQPFNRGALDVNKLATL